MVIGFSFLVFFSIQVFACECASPTTSEELALADKVFVGKVTSIQKMLLSAFYWNTTFPFVHKNYQFKAIVTFEVSKSWKGDSGQEIQVKSSFGGWCYNRNFTIGEEYVVFAFNTPNGLWASGCSNTGLVKSSEQTVMQLGQGRSIQTMTAHATLFPTRTPIVIAGVVVLLCLIWWGKRTLM